MAKDVLRLLIAFILVLVFAAFQALLFLDTIVLNPITYLDYINTPVYYDRLKSQIDFGLEEVGRYTNVSGEVLTSSVTDEEIKSYTQEAIQQMIQFFRGERTAYALTYNTDKIKAALETYVKDHTAQNNQAYDTNTEAEVLNIAQKAGRRIENYTMVIDPALLTQLGVDKVFQSVFSKLRLAEVFLMLTIILLIGALWLSNKNHRMRTFWWSGSSLMVSSIVLLIPGITVAFMNVAGRIGLTDNYMSWVLEESIHSLMSKWNFLQGGFLVLAFFLMLTYVFYRHHRIQTEKKSFKKP